MLRKCADPYLAMLIYRSTPLQNGYSPGELLMGRKLRTTLPILPNQLEPSTPDYSLLQKGNQMSEQNNSRILIHVIAIDS